MGMNSFEPVMTLQQAWALLQPRIPTARLVGDGATPLARVHTDTRTLQPGDLFVALKGERFDANAFLADARAGGAAAAIAHGGLEAAGLPGIEVPDSLAALGALATGWRTQFHLPLIGVTGSNGKTTVTQMIASILRAWQGEAAFATQGNFNNDIGVPLMLLRLRSSHAAAVIEMGMNHPGEIATLAAMAQPTVALVNNAQREHLEFMHTVEAVARENGSVFAGLPADGVAVFPAGDTYTGLWQSLSMEQPGRRTMTFGDGGDVRCAQATWERGAWAVTLTTPRGEITTRLHIAGRHNVTNALATTACTLAAGAPLAAIAQGLRDFTPVKGRSRAFSVLVAGREVTVVDDTYNANPDSMHAAIQVLAELPGPQLLVMGDMGEVGDQGPQFHAEAGALARAAGIPKLFALGAQSVHAVSAYGDGAQHFNEMAALLDAVRNALPTVGSVLVKGSRFMKTEQVVEAIVAIALPSEQQQKPINPREGHHGATH
ncbi:UDP-N-acetylmuramoyl-tripeptide--D-alanyl-D-alanine ligase [Acidovorax sp. D2M1]|uniref:UDP-N-acetylmuramoyl-tripeptide--D-alanyl-D-alanine ligase n=1 Tax=Acidovorax benzenivorans TaxID=2987520 RepID=A0ABT5RUK5_9BURK|nr:UDP-N-acetylmuramoyl-tripeptide--D-alanyl-D-alanine ligase [Acidovorax benzenivorans]MDD2176886.1 UDP-N-acetylmuramoyl-tripeptide--D-alanyl-D-alanine ligase [Acidovorax benzenivorans]